MLRWISVLAVAATSVVVVAALAADDAAKPADGKALFTQYKCNSCHTIKALGIAKQASDEEEDKDAKVKPPDLSDVGKKAKSAWIQKFLLKLEEKDGEKHRKKFRGTEAELKTIADWLETLKGDKKSAK